MNAPASAADPAQRNLAGRRLGRYEVLTQLASGGMAAVYVARAQGVAGFERLVAVKVLHPHLAHEDEFISMFLDEARLAARIRHPNVVATLDISDTQGDGFFIVMDYIEGDHLGALLQRAARQGQRLPPGVVGRVVIDALNGLSAAHTLTDEHGEPLQLVHRDVSPHNVMVGVDGISRLTDFGVAKAEVRLTATREGQFKGKLAYMAPEQASTGEADQRSDLFSMGVILWESLTGRRLFRGETNAETLHKVLQAEIPPPSSLWPELEPFDEVVLKALQREQDDRYQSAEDFSEALEAAARAAEGLATNRAVGDVVRTYTGEKLQQERDRIKGAIEFLGRSEMSEAAMPLPRDDSASASSSSLSSLSSISASGRRPVEDHNTLAARPGTLSQQMPLEEGGRSNKLVVVLGAIVLLLLGAVGAFALVVLSKGEDQQDAPAVDDEPAAADTVADEPFDPAAPGEGEDPQMAAESSEDETGEETTAEEEAEEAEAAAEEQAAEEQAAKEQAKAKAAAEEQAEEQTGGESRWQRRRRLRRQRQQARQEQQEQEQKEASSSSQEKEEAEPAPRPMPKPQPKEDDSGGDPIFNPYR